MDQEELQYDGDGADESFADTGDDFADDTDRSAMESELEAIKGMAVVLYLLLIHNFIYCGKK